MAYGSEEQNQVHKGGQLSTYDIEGAKRGVRVALISLTVTVTVEMNNAELRT